MPRPKRSIADIVRDATVKEIDPDVGRELAREQARNDLTRTVTRSVRPVAQRSEIS
jgi:hypothetical protein